jgi:hypothetical protein
MWFQIQLVPLNIGKQCRERWYNHLDPDVKRGDWVWMRSWGFFLSFPPSYYVTLQAQFTELCLHLLLSLTGYH